MDDLNQRILSGEFRDMVDLSSSVLQFETEPGSQKVMELAKALISAEGKLIESLKEEGLLDGETWEIFLKEFRIQRDSPK